MRLKPCAETIRDHFGSWNRAREIAGVKILHIVSDTEMLDALKAHPDLTENKWAECRIKPSSAAIKKRFGSWNRAREIAGVKILHIVSDTEMLDALKAHPDLTENKWAECRIKPSSAAIKKRFGSWNRAREIAGLEVRPHGWPGDGLSEEERERIVREAMKKDPTTAEARHILKKHASTYLKLTDGWAEETFNKWTKKREV